MPIGLLLAMLVLASALIVTGRSSGSRFFLGIGLAILVVQAVTLGRDGLRWILFAGPVTGTLALLALVAGSLFWADLLGLPRPLANRSGIGLRNPAWRFHARLNRLRADFVTSIRLAQGNPERRDEALANAQDQVRKERRLQAPNQAWGQLRDDIADDDEAWIDLIRGNAPSERLADHIEAFAPVIARWERLGEQAMEEHRRLSSPALERRARLVALTCVGVAMLLAGLAAGRAYHLLDVGLAEPTSWMALFLIGGGSVMLVGAFIAVVEALRARRVQPRA